MSKYKLKDQYRHKKVALSNGILIDNSFFARNGEAADRMIESNAQIARYFVTKEGAAIFVDSEEKVEETATQSTSTLTSKDHVRQVLERGKYREMQSLVSELDLETEGRASEDYEAALKDYLNS